jgi:large subunit ribosomal protein L20
MMHAKRRRNILKKTKGYRFGRKTKLIEGRIGILKAGVNAYRDRKRKKREMRGLWQIRISAAAREHGMSYSKFMGALKKKGIAIDRKILADVAMNHPEIFKAILGAAK